MFDFSRKQVLQYSWKEVLGCLTPSIGTAIYQFYDTAHDRWKARWWSEHSTGHPRHRFSSQLSHLSLASVSFFSLCFVFNRKMGIKKKDSLFHGKSGEVESAGVRQVFQPYAGHKALRVRCPHPFWTCHSISMNLSTGDATGQRSLPRLGYYFTSQSPVLGSAVICDSYHSSYARGATALCLWPNILAGAQKIFNFYFF